MQLIPPLVDFALPVIAYALLLLTLWAAVRDAWRQKQARRLDILFVVASPFVQGLLNRRTPGGPLWDLGMALLLAQPYFLYRLVRRFREASRAFDWTVAVAAAGGVVFMFWFGVATVPLFIGIGVTGTLALYPALAFVREARRTAGVTRMRLLYAAAATLMLASNCLVSLVPAMAIGRSERTVAFVGDFVVAISIYLSYGLYICYFLAFNPPRRLAARWQRTEQARFLSETAARDPEERGKRAAADLDRAVRRSMTGVRVVVALRPDPAQDDLLVRATSDTSLTGLRVVPVSTCLVGRAVETGVGVAGAIDQCEPELAKAFRGLGTGVLVAPIRTATQTWGMVAVVQRQGSLFPDDDLRLLVQFGRHTGTALDHAHLVIEARERERHLADRRVHAVEAQMGLTLDSIKDYAMFVIDRQGRVVTWHIGAGNIFGYGAAEITGQSAADLFTMTPEDWRAFVGEALESGQGRREGPCLRRGGARFIGATTLRPLDDEPGEPSGLVAVTRDVTEQRELESRLRQSQKMEAIGQLAGGISHDFNNMLTIISGHAEMLADALKDDDERRLGVGEIQKAAQRATALTGQLLAFTRRKMVAPKPIDLSRLVADLLPMLRRMIGEQVEIVEETAADGATVMGDRSQVEQILLNLAVNARDAMPTGGRLTIRTTAIRLDAAAAGADVAPGPCVLLQVTDTGVGMDAATESRIFEPFFTTKGFRGGTGLGLATVYGIVRQMGGLVRVESALERGTTFRLYFPQTRDREVLARPTVRPDLPRGTETLLLVEDDEAVRRFLIGTLKGHGYQVLAAGHPTAAVALVEAFTDPIDLVITDIMLPGGTGLDLVQAIAQIRTGVRALYISGYADGVIGHEGTFPKATHFLQKPFTAADLLARVRQILSEA